MGVAWSRDGRTDGPDNNTAYGLPPYPNHYIETKIAAEKVNLNRDNFSDFATKK
jgi:hypothetical protein